MTTKQTKQANEDSIKVNIGMEKLGVIDLEYTFGEITDRYSLLPLFCFPAKTDPNISSRFSISVDFDPQMQTTVKERSPYALVIYKNNDTEEIDGVLLHNIYSRDEFSQGTISGDLENLALLIDKLSMPKTFEKNNRGLVLSPGLVRIGRIIEEQEGTDLPFSSRNKDDFIYFHPFNQEHNVSVGELSGFLANIYKNITYGQATAALINLHRSTGLLQYTREELLQGLRGLKERYSAEFDSPLKGPGKLLLGIEEIVKMKSQMRRND